jgi:hypothetical protein
MRITTTEWMLINEKEKLIARRRQPDRCRRHHRHHVDDKAHAMKIMKQKKIIFRDKVNHGKFLHTAQHSSVYIKSYTNEK